METTAVGDEVVQAPQFFTEGFDPELEGDVDQMPPPRKTPLLDAIQQLSSAVSTWLRHNLLFLRTTLWFSLECIGLFFYTSFRVFAEQTWLLLHVVKPGKLLSALGDFGIREFCVPPGLRLEFSFDHRDRKRKLDPSIPSALQTYELIPALTMEFLDLEDRGALACSCRNARQAWRSPFLWREIVLPLHYDTLYGAVQRVPADLKFPIRIVMWPETFNEGIPREMSFGALWANRVRGCKVDKKIHVVGTRTADGRETVIRSTEGDALQIVAGGEGTTIENVRIEATRFACHAVSIHTGDVQLKRVGVTATGMNGIGIMVKKDAQNVLIEKCDMHGCKGCGSMLNYGAGPVTFRDSSICGNGWSGVGMFAASEARFENVSFVQNKLYAIGMAQDAVVDFVGDVLMEQNRYGETHRYLATQVHHGYHISGHYI